MTTPKSGYVEYEDFPDRVCDSCDQHIDGQMSLHWEEKDFDLCSDCLMNLYKKVFEPFSHNSQKELVYKKSPIPSDIRWIIWERDDFTCQYCGIREDLSIDHIMPEARGGKLIRSNLVTACKKCNSKKNAQTPEEVGMQLITDPRE